MRQQWASLKSHAGKDERSVPLVVAKYLTRTAGSNVRKKISASWTSRVMSPWKMSVCKEDERFGHPNRFLHALGFHAGANPVAPYFVCIEVHIYIPDKSSINRFVDN